MYIYIYIYIYDMYIIVIKGLSSSFCFFFSRRLVSYSYVAPSRSESTSFTEYSTGSFRDIETTFFDPASVFLSTH